jgi:diguanylate cyclase (GGDEF)-like protein
MAPQAEAISLAARVIQTVKQPVTLCGETFSPSVSIGVALSVADDDADSDSVLANADRALYAAKAAGRGRWRLARNG